MGGCLYHYPKSAPELTGLRIIHHGWWLGRCSQYFRGKPLNYSGKLNPDCSWTMVRLGEYPIGWGRSTGQVIKNHYPRSIRWC